MALLDDERELRSVGSTDPLELEVPVGESTNNVGHEPSRVNTSSVSATNETHSPQRAGAPSAVGFEVGDRGVSRSKVQGRAPPQVAELHHVQQFAIGKPGIRD